MKNVILKNVLYILWHIASLVVGGAFGWFIVGNIDLGISNLTILMLTKGVISIVWASLSAVFLGTFLQIWIESRGGEISEHNSSSGIVISRQSWHYKLLVWLKLKIPTNICSYCWKVTVVTVLSPMIPVVVIIGFFMVLIIGTLAIIIKTICTVMYIVLNFLFLNRIPDPEYFSFWKTMKDIADFDDFEECLGLPVIHMKKIGYQNRLIKLTPSRIFFTSILTAIVYYTGLGGWATDYATTIYLQSDDKTKKVFFGSLTVLAILLTVWMMIEKEEFVRQTATLIKQRVGAKRRKICAGLVFK